MEGRSSLSSPALEGKNPYFFQAAKENASVRDENRSLTLRFFDFSSRFSHDATISFLLILEADCFFYL